MNTEPHSNAARALLSVNALAAGYGQSLIVRGVSLRIGQNEIVTIIGPNGSGKSTLIKSIFGLTKIESGKINLRGQDITNEHTDRLVRMGIGYVPQAANVFPQLTVQENVEMGAFSLLGDVAPRVRRMREMFPLLEERWSSRAGHLSGGQRQVLALARALVTEPDILLLDEPTAGLAPQIVDSVLHQIAEINRRGVSILLVEQNAVKALKISDRAYILARGQNHFHDSAAAMLDNSEIGKIFLGMEGTSESETDARHRR